MGGSIPLFRFAGIQVSLHFSWFLAAAYFLNSGRQLYARPIFAVYEYLGLFMIILLHEFGHAFACRSVGGSADRILLWPFGGVAFVRPPSRPGAQLWSIAAGPLVNVALIPILKLLRLFLWNAGSADLYQLVAMISAINVWILLFNLLPVYPLDGGQILRSLLWYPFGRIKSLRIASVLGLIGAAAFILWAFQQRSLWIGLLAFFLMTQALNGWRQAKLLQQQEDENARVPPPVDAPRPPVL